MIARVSTILSAFAVLAACTPSGEPAQPQILSLNYEVRPLQDATIDQIRDGTRQVEEFLPADPCNFTASFAEGFAPTLSISGEPGNNNFSFLAVSENPSNLATTNPARCEAFASYDFQINERNIALGVPVINGKFDATVGSDAFRTLPGYFQATVNTFDPSNDYTTGTVEFVAKATGGQALIGAGTFALKD